jgi:class 3 adenylate cyclase
MAVFIGDQKVPSAIRAALKINWAVKKIINPGIKAKYTDCQYEVQQAVGIDSGSLFVARTGIRGANDLVWVGRAANYAAKLCSVRDGTISSWITKAVYDALTDDTKYGQDRQLMWVARPWTAHGVTIYGSTFWWPIT